MTPTSKGSRAAFAQSSARAKPTPMEALRDRMEADLKIGTYSPSTRKIYLLYARLLASPLRIYRDGGRTTSQSTVTRTGDSTKSHHSIG